jgi:serine/threonine-protein kinase
LSPDGSQIVYVAVRGGVRQLFARAIDSFDSKPIPGTEGAETPFFSPDGQSVGFFAQGKLRKVSLSGGAPLDLCNAQSNRGASWGPDHTIIFTPNLSVSALFQVSDGGGTPKELVSPDRTKTEYSLRWPQILPGGKAAIYTIWGNTRFDDSRIAVVSLETGEHRELIQGGAYGRYVPSGHLLYARSGGLLAVPFDLSRLQVTGSPVSIVEGVSMSPTTGETEFSTSADGSLAYVQGGWNIAESTLLWVDRKGATTPLPAPARSYASPRLSPDGQRLAVAIEGTDPGVWIYEVARGTLSQLGASALIPAPIWTADGRRVTRRSPKFQIDWLAADGSGSAEGLTSNEGVGFQIPTSWSPDGKMLAFTVQGQTTGWDIWLLSLTGERKEGPFLQTPANEGNAIFSPDGRWLAYVSDESGRDEVYVRPVEGSGGKWQISTQGGGEPVWARSGKELFYRDGDKMMAVAVESKPQFTAGKPKLLFEGHYETSNYTNYLRNYDVSLDGQRFLMVKAGEQVTSAAQINIVLNWFEELKRRVPTGTK